MRLPDGVHLLPRREKLIAKDSDAIVRIETGLSFPGNAKYEIKDRSFADAIGPNLLGDWADFDRLFKLGRSRRVRVGGAWCESPVLYSGAEHRGPVKLPNITIVPNLSTLESRGLSRPFTVFGCTMGHHHPAAPGGPRIQEVYEFQSYGMMVIDREAGEVELWVAQDGDKVAVPDRCHMTLFNLGDDDQPLITLDYANPDCNKSDKKLIGSIGPILLAWYDDLEVAFTLNRLYINGRDHSAGVRLPVIGEDIAQRQVRIPRRARLDLGMLLHEQLTKNPDVIGRFAQLGLRIKAASPEADLGPLPPGGGPRLHFARPLAEASRPGTQVHRYFFPDAPSKGPGPGRAPGIAGEESRIADEKGKWVQLERKNAPLTIVVEGAGDWVEKCYRPLFGDFFNKKQRDIRVFYVDDTRWKARPEWTNSLERWEVYLDKADVAEFARYRNLLPDVVFVVTPDFTHSGIARSWLGRAALVFVEKPFDSQSDNVDKLLRDLGQRRGTAVLGLDHYQFYALPVHELKPAIVEHLGDALAEVRFYMTETRPIERERARTLQYGLTLDLIPHFIALLAYFGDVGTIDEIQVIQAGQYRPMIAAEEGTLKVEHLRDASGLARRLKPAKDAMSSHVRDRLPAKTILIFDDAARDSSPSMEMRQAIVDGLNDLILGKSLYEQSAFAGVSLSDEMRALLAQNSLEREALTSLNRWLLEDAFPNEIACSRKDISQEFRSETYSKVGFVFHDYSGNGFDVACTAVTGKGFSQNAKFMEIEGRSGNAIRIDMKRKPNPDPAPGYPWDHLFFLLSANVSTPSGLAVREIPDPYDSHRMLRILTDPADPQRFCRPMERKRYAKLLQDLLDGTGIAVSATLNIDEAMKIVMVLDRIWRAVQAFPREIYSPLGSLDPLRF